MSDAPPPPPPPEPTSSSDPTGMVPPPTPVVPPPPPATYAPTAGVAVANSGPVGTPRSIGLIIFLTIITFGIWTIIWSFQNGNELKNYAKTGIGGLGYLVITVIIHPVTMFLMAGEVEQLYRREGKEPPITMIWGLWFLLPFVGYFIWYIRIQKALNEYWVANGAPAR